MNQQKTGRFIRTLRTEKKLTQEQLAEILGVSNRSVSRWENGVNMPELDLLILIAKYFDVEIGELLEGERREETMDHKTEEALLQAADYSNEEKACFSKKIRRAFIASLIGIGIYVAMDMLELSNILPYKVIADFVLGLVTGTLLIGTLYSTNHIAKLKAAKLRLFRHKTAQDKTDV